MHHSTDRIAHTTAFVTPVVEQWLEREIAQWLHPMKDRSDDSSHHERMLLPQSYISLLTEEFMVQLCPCEEIIICKEETSSLLPTGTPGASSALPADMGASGCRVLGPTHDLFALCTDRHDVCCQGDSWY